jgi:hypothetical protein
MEESSMSADVLEKILSREKSAIGQQFIAPVAGGHRVRIHLGGFLWECLLDREFSGWGVFEMAGQGRAKLLREAEVYEKERYLEAFPRVSLVLFFRDSRGIWWARDSRRGRFVEVLLVEGHLIFDSVTAVFDGTSYWFADLDNRIDPRKSRALRDALEATMAPEILRIADLTAADRELYEMALVIQREMEEQHKDVFIRKIEKALRTGDGELLEAAEVNNGFRIRWKTMRGETFTSMVDRNLSVVSAGLCLSGGDKRQDLTTLASLLKNQKRR